MLFNSFEFIFLFLPVVVAGTFLIGARSAAHAALWLALASCVFYSVWDPRFLPVLATSIVINYGFGRLLAALRPSGSSTRPRVVLALAISLNLAALVYYKYIDFIFTAVNAAFGVALPPLGPTLPLGISFFTFTQIAFLVDVHRGIAAETNFVRYLLFVTYFPHLIAGPVLHHGQMMPQFKLPSTYRPNASHIAVGLAIFTIGLVKKVGLADTLSQYATPVFNAAAAHATVRFVDAWIGALAYTLQLYFDFSGYSDMAVGLSLMLNIRLPMNFFSPYKSANIIEFWRRWHISLSTFLRDYLYIPLGGGWGGQVLRFRNLVLTMAIGGIWHGAGWTFVVWGAYHGVLLALNHAWLLLKQSTGIRIRIPGIVSVLATFLLVVIGWVYFRAASIDAAREMLRGMFGVNGVILPPLLQGAFAHAGVLVAPESIEFAEGVLSTRFIFESTLAIMAGLAIVWTLPNVNEIYRRYAPTVDADRFADSAAVARTQRLGRIAFSQASAAALGLAFFVAVLLMSGSRSSEFLYFQF